MTGATSWGRTAPYRSRPGSALRERASMTVAPCHSDSFHALPLALRYRPPVSACHLPSLVPCAVAFALESWTLT